MIISKKTLLSASVSAALSIIVPVATAQQLEEVVVTATKRAEGLQDVPIAISVIGEQEVFERGIQNMEELVAYVPNVNVTEGPAANFVFIRGIGSGTNFGFEQSVGIFVDDVYFGRGRSSRNRFLDIERVEVLKGPQSTLFGKNTIAGAFNITTAAPTEEFESFFEASYRSELEATKFTGVVSGPITDTMRGRLVAQKYDDEGYVENRALGGEDGPAQDNWTLRGRLDWDATDNLFLALKLETGTFDVVGRMNTISEANPVAVGLYQAFGDPSFEPGFNYEQWDLSFEDEGIFDDTETTIAQLTAEYQIGDSTLRSITAYTNYEFTNELDADLSPLRFISRGRTEEHTQFTQEFIWTSSIGTNIDYLAGFFYQNEDLENDRHTRIELSALPPIEQGIFASLEPLGLVGLPSGALDTDIPNFFQQDAETWSVFVDFTFNLSDSLRLIAGIRYSEDEKEVFKVGELTNTSGILPDPLYEAIYGPGGLNLATVHQYELDRQEEHTTGQLVAQWDATDQVMLYARWSNGYKSGGFDEDNGLGNLDAAEFEDENVDSIEFGAKANLGDGRGRLNVAYFAGDYEDTQVSSFVNNAYVVGNAAQSEVQGIEADLIYAVTDHLTINGAFAWLDATFESYPDAPCTENQRIAWVSDPTNVGLCRQDLTGQPLVYAPEYSFNAGFRYETPVASNYLFDISLNYVWVDDFNTEGDLDPVLEQESYGKLNGRIGFSDADGQWQVYLLGRNLTDEETFSAGGEVPLAELGFSNTFFKHIEPPRTLELGMRYVF